MKNMDDDSIIKRYLDGESVLSLSKSLSVSRDTIQRRLDKAEVRIRTFREATLCANKRKTPEEIYTRARAGKTGQAPQIEGNPPSKEETSIYVLKLEGVVFYVGATKKPAHRFSCHLKKFGEGLTMHIQLNVPDSNSVVEECREIVLQSDLGATLINSQTPAPSSTTRDPEGSIWLL